MTTTERAPVGHPWALLLVLSGNMVLDATEVSLAELMQSHLARTEMR